MTCWPDGGPDARETRLFFLLSVVIHSFHPPPTYHPPTLLQEYAARIHNLRSYDAISRDIISRWVYPLCPDTNLFPGAEYQFRRGHIYM